MEEPNNPLEKASEELKYLLDRGYRKEPAIAFVGDHHQLPAKARNRLMREVFCSDDISDTGSKLTPIEELEGADLALDGFNVLITVEACLFGGEAFICQDGMMRDNAMAFSNYKIGDKTREAADRVVALLERYRPRQAVWVFDSQISGSGRIAEYVRKRMADAGLSGKSTTCPDADSHLLRLGMVSATSDTVLIRKLKAVVDIPQAAQLVEEK